MGKIFLDSVKKYRVLWIFAIGMLIMAVISWDAGTTRQPLVYGESTDRVVAVVEGEEITLKDFAVYVVHQETETDRLARIYNPDNPKEYWGLHINGQFIKIAARDAAVAMAIHDELFYQLSLEYNLKFTEEELTLLESDVMDLWYDMIDNGSDQVLGVTRQDVYDSMYKIACVQKCQYIYAKNAGVDCEDYDFSGEEYKELLKKYNYKIYDEVVDRLDFGRITINNQR